jgi:hypothetical protein
MLELGGGARRPHTENPDRGSESEGDDGQDQVDGEEPGHAVMPEPRVVLQEDGPDHQLHTPKAIRNQATRFEMTTLQVSQLVHALLGASFPSGSR